MNVRLFMKLFLCLHLVAMLTIFVLPKFIHGNDVSKKNSSERIKKDSDLPSSSKNYESKEKDEEISATNEISIHANADDVDDRETSKLNSSDGQHHIRKTDKKYLLKDLISKEVNKIKDETDNLSNMLKGKIEAANIEGLIDKTVSGIVELKDDLMRMNEPEVYGPTSVENLRKRNNSESVKGSSSLSGENGVDAFLKKETTVIPAVLSNANSAK